MQKALRNENFAILYRTNAQSSSFEEALRKLGIKYRIIGGQSFYQRKEIKDLLAYLRFTVNQRDEEAFKRIINLPKRGIGDATVAKIAVTASENNIAIWDVVANIGQYASGRTISPIEQFGTLIKSFKILVEVKEKTLMRFLHTLPKHRESCEICMKTKLLKDFALRKRTGVAERD
jgi:DNA helicase-2/ATP-dependent DNA helicase PcrA